MTYNIEKKKLREKRSSQRDKIVEISPDFNNDAPKPSENNFPIIFTLDTFFQFAHPLALCFPKFYSET
jgi:hypothetical protein